MPLITGAGSLLGAIFAYFILPVWVAYILKDKTTLVATFDRSLPKAWRFDTWALIKTVERDFGHWAFLRNPQLPRRLQSRLHRFESRKMCGYGRVPCG